MTSCIGEIRWFPFGYETQGWAICDGRLLAITKDTEILFSLIGNYFGGDGRSDFALPDLRGRAIVGTGGNPHQNMGLQYGMETVSLTQQQMPAHTHAATTVASAGNRQTATGARPAGTTFNLYGGGSSVLLDRETVGTEGYGQPHDNMQPFLVLNACICYQGAWPQRSSAEEHDKTEGDS